MVGTKHGPPQSGLPSGPPFEPPIFSLSKKNNNNWAPYLIKLRRKHDEVYLISEQNVKKLLNSHSVVYRTIFKQ